MALMTQYSTQYQSISESQQCHWVTSLEFDHNSGRLYIYGQETQLDPSSYYALSGALAHAALSETVTATK